MTCDAVAGRGSPAVPARERPPQRASAAAAADAFAAAAVSEPECEASPGPADAAAAAEALPRRKRGRPRKVPLPAGEAAAQAAAPPAAKRRRGQVGGACASGAAAVPPPLAAAGPAADAGALRSWPSLGLPSASSADWRLPGAGRLDTLSPLSRRAPSGSAVTPHSTRAVQKEAA
jgi:hypothetical protein